MEGFIIRFGFFASVILSSACTGEIFINKTKEAQGHCAGLAVLFFLSSLFFLLTLHWHYKKKTGC